MTAYVRLTNGQSYLWDHVAEISGPKGTWLAYAIVSIWTGRMLLVANDEIRDVYFIEE